jgi:hypothetical protein
MKKSRIKQEQMGFYGEKEWEKEREKARKKL